ncbi:MAG: colicin E3/pyocin S6 family cytotoxin [Haliea sp.]|nr:colicin E3/pyocin S6 family cytotoxin [Haliea sp.]
MLAGLLDEVWGFMASGDFGGHHCKVCQQQALEAKRRVKPPEEDLQGNWDRRVAGDRKAHEAAEARLEASREREARQQELGYIFAKSCNLPDGITNHNNPNGFVPVELLKDYGDWAVLGTAGPLTATAALLNLIDGSTSGTALAARLGGQLSLGLTEVALTAGVGAGAIVGTIGMLIPNTSLAPDSAFYTKEQYAMLSLGSTRVRVHVAQLPDKSVTAYGFYTGKHPDWQKIPVIAATARGDNLVADIGQGVELIWTPAVDPNAVLGIPALEGAPKLPAVWVYPPTEQANKILVNPVHSPDYQDAIIWFPTKPEIAPIYISLSLPGDHKYYQPPKGLTAFPDATKDKSKASVQGGGKNRKRWKDSKGRIYEWDSQHGTVEKYDAQGKHLGEFNPETGEQTKPAKPGRTTPK